MVISKLAVSVQGQNKGSLSNSYDAEGEGATYSWSIPYIAEC